MRRLAPIVGFLLPASGPGHVNVTTGQAVARIAGPAMADAGASLNAPEIKIRARGCCAPDAGAISAASAMIGPILPPSTIPIHKPGGLPCHTPDETPAGAALQETP